MWGIWHRKGRNSPWLDGKSWRHFSMSDQSDLATDLPVSKSAQRHAKNWKKSREPRADRADRANADADRSWMIADSC